MTSHLRHKPSPTGNGVARPAHPKRGNPSQPTTRTPSDRSAFLQKMQDMAQAALLAMPSLPDEGPTIPLLTGRPDTAPGLKLRELEETRWSVSPQVARAKLIEVGIMVAGRRGGLIYSWRTIFIAEGVEPRLAEIATPQSHPFLFDDLVGERGALEILGLRSGSTLRKRALSGALPQTTWVSFGSRGVRRFRPGLLRQYRLAELAGKVV